MTIKIGIDAGDFIPFGKVNSGIKRIINSFLKEIIKIKNNNYIFNYYFFEDKNEISQKKHNAVQFKKLPQRFYGSLFLPLQAIKDKNDIFLGFSGNLPYLLSFSKIKKIIFLYDMGFFKFPQHYSNADKLQLLTKQTIKQADKIIVLSEHGKREILDVFPKFKTDKIIKIYAGFDHLKFDHLKKDIKDQKLEKYFLYVGVIKPIKNISSIFKYFYYFLKTADLPAQAGADKYSLLLIGSKEKDYFDNLKKNKYYLIIKDKIVFKDNISDEELIKYYLNAVAVLNFSFNEGFCFPVLEALYLGKTVIVNNLPIYNEYKHFNELMVGSSDKDIIQLMIKSIKKKNTNIRKAGSVNIFTWERFGKKLLNLF